ncbi:MAG: prolyl oligopeptidase family serine peptidase [Hymenobacteraceae bacterium]|nr:prolyl oligopeptidase family serine peptidase [Hymenobacteraceae bacterium]
MTIRPIFLFRILAVTVLVVPVSVHAQSRGPGPPILTIPLIMQAPAGWGGISPSHLRWSPDSRTVYFDWNPARLRQDSVYSVPFSARTAPRLVSGRAVGTLPDAENGAFDRARRQLTYTRHGDLFVYDLRRNVERRLTLTTEAERQPAWFSPRGNEVISFRRGDNLFSIDLASGQLTQLTDLRAGMAPGKTGSALQRATLEREQVALFGVLRARMQDRTAAAAAAKRPNAGQERAPKPVYLGEQEVEELRVSPPGRFATYRLTTPPAGAERIAQVPAFVTASGYTEQLATRSKVGDRPAVYTLGIYDRQRDSAYVFDPKGLPGLYDVPAYRKEYSAPKDTTRVARALLPFGPFWSPDGKRAVLALRALDNKDRWLVLVDVSTGRLTRVLSRQHDDAWIGGPGINDEDSEGNVGWLDDQTVWYQSEETGFSHLYTANATTGAIHALTNGGFEVQQVVPPQPNAKWWYLTTNETDLGEKHLWRLPRAGGPRERITPAGRGAYEVTISPDGQRAAARFSTATRPWELVTFDLKPSTTPTVRTHSPTAAWEAYPWRTPEIVTVTARDGTPVRARLYRPTAGVKQGPAVIFVHGAGYLQNAHYWWSHYFREYQFHNLLADRGYTVLDVDYRGSAGYGRAFRTGIYRHMGGKDLSDEVDAAKWLVGQQGVDARHIGIYGGSYGGFMTLMALFTEPDVFASGAALRSVTDWAHYNHGYTSNILNTPQSDSVAYHRSSPIYFAAGLNKPLLICHGMVDTNVHFQDVVRLSQRFIELGKKDWELASYPVEDHAFVEPSSWTDEYERILALFERTLRR